MSRFARVFARFQDPYGRFDPATLRPSGISLALIAVLVAHVLLTLWFLPLDAVFSDQPLTGGDFDMHASQAFRVGEALRTRGKSWAYDVHLHAGFPNGALHDVGNKGWELWTFALSRCGVPEAQAFNLFALVSVLLLPLCIVYAARRFGFQALDATVAAGLGVCLWFFDSLVHFMFTSGKLSFLVVSYGSVVALALMQRWTASRSPRVLAGLGVLLAVLCLVHPYAFLILAVPMLVAYLRAVPVLRVRDHLSLGATCLLVIAANAYWMVIAARHAFYWLDARNMMVAKVQQLAFDFLELMQDPSTAGDITPRTGFRWLVLGLGGVGLWQMWRKKHPAFVVFCSALGAMLGLGYVGGSLALVKEIQPYRFVLPALFLATLPAGNAVGGLVREKVWTTLSPLARPGGAVLLLVIAQHLSSEVLYFFPSLLPPVEPMWNGASAGVSATGFAPHRDYRILPEDSSKLELAAWLDVRRDEGRVAVQLPELGEALATRSKAEILGGHPFMPMIHTRSNPFRHFLEEEVSPDALRKLLETYAVRYVVLSAPERRIENDKDLFEEYTSIGGARIFRTKLEPRFIAEGPGQVHASTNALNVWGTDPTRAVVLRYHYHAALACKPGCEVRQAKNPTEGQPFIRIPAPHPSAFRVFNGYDRR
ncbi:MAG TPA: hypothetical protein VHM19_21980 [Polyangiales bacterium]|nr:hypothetical protein [Polyangiales bacterium]